MFQLSGLQPDEPRKRKRVTEGSLIDAIGRGINCAKVKVNESIAARNSTAQVLGDALASDENLKDWQAKVAELDCYVQKGDVEQFDAAMALLLEGSSTVENKNRGNDSAQKHMSRREGKLKACRHKIAYALSKIFVYDKSPNAVPGTGQKMQPRLRIKFLPAKTFGLLLSNGYISLQQIESALKQTKTIPLTTSLDATALIQALAAFDESLQTLNNVFAERIYLGPQDVVYTLRVAIAVLRHSENKLNLKTITNDEAASDQGLENAMQIVHYREETSQLSKVLDDENTQITHSVIRACLTRLYHCHESDIRKALKQELLRNDMIFFIDYLRLELAQGGWLSRHVESVSIPLKEYLQQGNQISIAAKLLNCAIDSLGTGGWILDSSTEYNMLETGDTISYMKAEVSAALEGIEEAAYLQGMLQEVLLYSKTAPHGLPEPGKALQRPRIVKPITVPLEDELSHALPLGMKGLSRVSMTKIGAGGEIQSRSIRDVGRLKSHQVGKYSFERILI
ncbi:MAG: hypothetical protein Q9187_002022 [Circinaria calcarea]